MLMILLLAQDTANTANAGKEKDEMTFVASECILGCILYPALVGAWTGVMTEKGDVGLCCGMTTPLISVGIPAMIAINQPIRKPMGVATFSWTIDGFIWSSLVYANLLAWSESADLADPKIYFTTALFGAVGGNIAGYIMGLNGYGSEGSHMIKLFTTFQAPYYYFQLKRLIFGTFYAGYDKSDIYPKTDLTLATLSSIGGSLISFNITKNWKFFTGGDAMFMGANVVKGSVVASAPVRTLAVALCNPSVSEGSVWFGTVFLDAYTCNGEENTILTRLSSLSQLSGALASTYISYKIIKKEDFGILQGLIYSVVPIFAYYSAAAPLILLSDDRDLQHAYLTVMPLVQVGLDVGTSYIVYKLFTKRE